VGTGSVASAAQEKIATPSALGARVCTRFARVALRGTKISRVVSTIVFISRWMAAPTLTSTVADDGICASTLRYLMLFYLP
jgi:hypothetical protein